MRNNIAREDLDAVISYLKTEDPILTNGANVRAFEAAWSKWLGVKYSVFVNSGSSANLLSLFILKERFPEGGEVIVPPLTWVSDIVSVIVAGFRPVFCDIAPQTLGLNFNEVKKKITKETRAVFITHAQGFNAVSDELIDLLDEKKVILIEDVCESHGATHNGKKVGTFGWMSNFSFYYAHHMSTIEGGMICTNDESTYQSLRILRSHGMLRESTSDELKREIQENNPELNPEFIFTHVGFNMRNTEIGGILGQSQLLRLSENVSIRTRNLELFLSGIDNNLYQTDFAVEGSSNYAFNLILKKKDYEFVQRLMKHLKENGVEFRRGSAGGGNQLRQPYLKNYVDHNEYKNYPITEHIHFFGFYLGNYPSLSEDEVKELVHLINNIK
ncbi:DegT/DnrJ/EryC1/StrS family aminotransferase [Betaproteobacteria bacterium]|nr:DegT/DnrJ/EryC1/StrS family aminotransferase [Betaproteobacteria bacterium]